MFVNCGSFTGGNENGQNHTKCENTDWWVARRVVQRHRCFDQDHGLDRGCAKGSGKCHAANEKPGADAHGAGESMWRKLEVITELAVELHVLVQFKEVRQQVDFECTTSDR